MRNIIDLNQRDIQFNNCTNTGGNKFSFFSDEDVEVEAQAIYSPQGKLEKMQFTGSNKSTNKYRIVNITHIDNHQNWGSFFFVHWDEGGAPSSNIFYEMEHPDLLDKLKLESGNYTFFLFKIYATPTLKTETDDYFPDLNPDDKDGSIIIGIN